MKLNWGHGIAITYLVFVAAIIYFVVIASQQNYDLVSADYYKDAVNYQERINSRINAMNQTEGLQSKFILEKSVVEIVSTMKEEVQGQVFFYKPDNAKSDFVVPIKLASSGQLQIPMQNKSKGYWKLKTTWNSSAGACFSESTIMVR